jgi:hypothetical protein
MHWLDNDSSFTHVFNQGQIWGGSIAAVARGSRKKEIEFVDLNETGMR